MDITKTSLADEMNNKTKIKLNEIETVFQRKIEEAYNCLISKIEAKANQGCFILYVNYIDGRLRTGDDKIVHGSQFYYHDYSFSSNSFSPSEDQENKVLLALKGKMQHANFKCELDYCGPNKFLYISWQK